MTQTSSENWKYQFDKEKEVKRVLPFIKLPIEKVPLLNDHFKEGLPKYTPS